MRMPTFFAACISFWLSRASSFSTDIETLLKQMTLDEKIGQLLQIDIQSFTDYDGSVNYDKLRDAININKPGSILNSHFSVMGLKGWTAQDWRHIMVDIYNTIDNSTLKAKVPIVYGIDSIHGANFVYESAIFPHQLALGATFNTSLVYEIGKVTAKDT